MPRRIELNAVAYDTQPLVQGQASSVFFADRPKEAEDETGRSESDLVDWIIAQRQPFSILLRTLGLPDHASAATHVTTPFLSGTDAKPGDIDLLLCSRVSPHRAVGIEFKRVRVRGMVGEGQRLNRLTNIGHAPSQVNGLHHLGFSQTYLGVVAVVHDLTDPQRNFLWRGTTETTLSRVVEFVEALPLHEDVGILYVEIAQPLEASIEKSGMVSAGIFRRANVVEQPHDLTARVKRYFEGRRSGV